MRVGVLDGMRYRPSTIVSSIGCLLLVAACGNSADQAGGGGYGSDGGVWEEGPAPAVAATPELSIGGIKTFHVTWSDVGDATHYKLLEDSDGSSVFNQVGDDILSGIEEAKHSVPLYGRLDARYLLQSCNANGCTDSASITAPSAGDLFDGIGYFKASNAHQEDSFGTALGLSADGSTLAVAADDETYAQGAVYIFTRSGAGWSEEALLKASNADNDHFGSSLSLSADGNTLVVGAPMEDSDSLGVNGPSNSGNTNSGAAYVFTRQGASWTEEAFLKASNDTGAQRFGGAVGISGDGQRVAVGAAEHVGGIGGINGEESYTSSVSGAGAVYVFRRDTAFRSNAAVWSQEAFIKADIPGRNDYFGSSLALNKNGEILVVAAPLKDSEEPDIEDAGAVYVFQNDFGWYEQAYLKASNEGLLDNFGSAVDVSADGKTVVVGARHEDSAATGINGNEASGAADASGAAYLFSRSDTGWSQEAYLKASNTGEQDRFGTSVSLSSDGNTLAVSAVREGSSSVGINSDQDNDSALETGAAYLFTRTAQSWQQQAYLKPIHTGGLPGSDTGSDHFGTGLSLSGDGSTLAVGAPDEDSNATGIGGDSSSDSNSSFNSGAVYLY